MQEEEKILYIAIGSIIKRRRKKLKKYFTNFCYENDIPTTTMGYLENARHKVHFSTIYKTIEALGMSIEDFALQLKNELPENFTFKKPD